MEIFQSILAVFIGVSGLWWNHRSRINDQYRQTQTLLSEAHSGGLAAARHRIGSLVEGAEAAQLRSMQLNAEDTQHIFDMLWFFQRAWATYRSLENSAPFIARRSKGQTYLIDSLCPEIRTWRDYTDKLNGAIGSNGKPLDLRPSNLGLEQLISYTPAVLR